MNVYIPGNESHCIKTIERNWPNWASAIIPALFTLFFLAGCAAVAQGGPSPGTYAYMYEGNRVHMTPSESLVAFRGLGDGFDDFTIRHSLLHDPLNTHGAMKTTGYNIYRYIPRDRNALAKSLTDRIDSAMRMNAAEEMQPVFEQGGAILIPSDEILLGFKTDTSLAEAVQFLKPVAPGLGIIDIQSLKHNRFMLRIDAPSNGRCYIVCQTLSDMERVLYAEPNHVVLPLSLPKPPARHQEYDTITEKKHTSGPNLVRSQTRSATPENENSESAPPSWVTLAAIDFESAQFPPPGWTSTLSGASDAGWGRTNYLSHNGSFSMYCALNGSDGVLPPGPAPLNMDSYIQSPAMDLSGYEEVYLELWFYAINDVFNSIIYDRARVGIADLGSTNRYYLDLALSHQGDCTVDPTTDSGWRRFLFRVPETYRKTNQAFRILYESDAFLQEEGAYIDDIRIVATTEIDTDPVGNDPFSSRLQDLKNNGQIAGIGTDDNDLRISDGEAWNLVTPDSSVTVAIIDDGVDLTHPDLNLVTGYEPSGMVGGGPRGDHGTACAGEAGALLNNHTGVAGTAPGISIMPVYMGASFYEVASAIDVAVANGADILSNSWGWVGSPSAVITQALSDAITAGTVVLFSAGNGPDRSPYTYKVAYPGA
ncbi:MAG: hypothetical protein D3926_11785, partial [Desulfobacteraceae bacterium]